MAASAGDPPTVPLIQLPSPGGGRRSSPAAALRDRRRRFPRPLSVRRRPRCRHRRGAGRRTRVAIVGLLPVQRPRILRLHAVGPRADAPQVRALCVHLRHGGHVGDRHADRRPAGRRHGGLPGGDRAAQRSPRRLVHGGDAGGHSQRRLRLLGPVRVRPGLRLVRGPAGRAEPGGNRPRSRRRHPRRHDLALRRRRFLRRDPGGPPVAAGGGAGPGGDALASDLAGGDPLRPAGHLRRLFPRPGPRAGRDDGRHHARRQLLGTSASTSSARATPSPASSPTSSPRRPTTCTCPRWSNSVWCCCWSAWRSAPSAVCSSGA